ncbi:MAG TPA: ACP phosphodiesterase [Rhodocyclaceae bacterium]|nr:ACP phosphodiesterase [Rhodocyclaceae bacterium]
MNFLAHLLLAGDAETDRLGAVMGDFVKGPLPGSLPPELADGVALHRSVDTFADDHRVFRRSRARMSPERRRYGGILVDMFYDHLLARHWSRFHDQPLAEFAQDAYRLLRTHTHRLPQGLVAIVPHMEANDWLASYAELESIDVALNRMSRRLQRTNPLGGGVVELEQQYAEFEADFFEFLPDAMAFTASLRDQRYIKSRIR